jgi:hypothetical protein
VIDIVSAETGTDMGVLDTQTMKAANILSVQLGALEYAQDLGIDLKYFLSEDFKFQNESFKSYLIEVLANRGINVSSVVETVEALFSQYNFNLSPEETSTGLVAR